MPRCAICQKDRRLTKAHIFPDALIRKILPDTRIVYSTEQGFFTTNNYTINDECYDCNQAGSKVFDDRVSEILDILDLLDTRKPATIELEEPWFTLYCLRIFWATQRPKGPVPPEVKDAVRAILLGTSSDYANILGPRIKIFFCQEPPELKYLKTRIPLNKYFSAGGAELKVGNFSMFMSFVQLGR